MENSVASGDNLAFYKRLFEDARDANGAYLDECAIDRDYFDGYQWTADERKVLESRKQPPIYFNETKVAIRGLVGVWEQGESDPRAWPNEPNDEQSADVATKVLRYVKDEVDWADTRTYAALNYFVEGTTAVHVGVAENGRPTVDRIAFEEFFHDPRSRRLDFKDARYLGIAKWMFADDVAGLYADAREEVLTSLDSGATDFSVGGDTYDDRPTGERSGWIDGKMRRVFVVEMYHRQGGQWMRCVFWGRGVLEAGPSPYVNAKGVPVCPIIARSCYIDRDNKRFGEVRDLRSPQDAINQRESKLLHLANNRQVQASDPNMALGVDAEVVRREAARPDGVLPPGWQPVPTSDMAAGQALLLDSARQFFQRIGQNPGVLAAQSASASGRAQSLRQQAGMTDSAMTLNGLRRWELDVFRAAWERCRQFWRAPDYVRVTGDAEAPEFTRINEPVYGDPQPMLGPDGQVTIGQPVLGYENALAEMDVDIVIDTVPNTANLAAEQFETIAQLMQAGIPIPPTALIRASSLTDKQAILDEMEQPNPMQQAQGELAMRAGEAEVAGKEANAKLTLAKVETERAKPVMDAMQAGFRQGASL